MYANQLSLKLRIFFWFTPTAFYRTAEFGGIADARTNDYRKWGIISEEGDAANSR